MAVVTRYFSTSSAGAADGTTWADRAALFSAGNWSSVITGFNFSGTDSLKCLIGPGSYTCSQLLQASLFTNAPTVANLLFLTGCDSSGNMLTPPDPDWTADMAAPDDSTLPVIATTTNISTSTLANCSWYLIKFTASGRNGAVFAAGHFDWCVLTDSTANTSAVGFGLSTSSTLTNSVVSMTGSSYDAAVTGSHPAYNVKMIGVAGSSGNRDGWRTSGSSTLVMYDRLCASGFGGDGLSSSSATAGHVLAFKRCVAANNGGTGILFPATASQTGINVVEDCCVTGNGAYGIDATNANVIVRKTRLRDNTSGNLNGMGNYPTDFNDYTTDSDDATEYVSAGSNDFRIKNTAAIWGYGYGVSDQPAAASGTTIAGSPLYRGMVA